MDVRKLAFAASLSALAVLTPTTYAVGYPIDCAILLCLAGGFPASAECSAAKAEVIRRITPWPIEPPLQLWQCPMGSSGISLPSGEASSVPPDVAKYRDAIELWQLSKHVTTGSGGRDVYITTIRNSYSPSGSFVREKVSHDALPDWLDAVVRSKTGTTLVNEYGRSFGAIVLRTQDYTGAYSTEWVSY
jgi:hypothetical protein